MRYRPIRRNGEFGRVYARGKSYVNQALVLYVLKTRSKRTRVGLTATKKIGHAVQRNRARRVMKAAIDEHLDYNIGGYDLVFVARGMTPGSRAGSSVPSWPSFSRRPDCRIRRSSRAQSLLPPCLRPADPRREHLSEGPVRADPALPAVYQPGSGPELPLFPLVQPVRHRGHPHPRLSQGAAADRMADRPVQSAGPLGLRSRAGEGPLEKSGPALVGVSPVFHKTRKISGKRTSPSMLL